MREKPMELDSSYNKIEDKLTKVKIDVRRTTENKNRNTFDFIVVDIPIAICERKECLSFCKRNFKEIVRYATPKIEKRLERFNVPFSFLRCEKATVTRDYSLNLIFALKEA